ncbi:MAG: dicarboxylate/amino acid:cation symporter [bacterium]
MNKPWYKQLHWQIALGLVVALVFSMITRALVLPAADATAEVTELALGTLANVRAPFAFVGDVFIRLLKLIVMPLIIFSVISGIQTMGDASQLGRVGWRTMAYYMITTLIAVCVGLAVVNIVQPGMGLNLSAGNEPLAVTPKPLLEVFRDIVPSNFFAALTAGDMLPTIFVSILVGLALLTLGEEGRPLTKLVEAANALIFRVTDWIMKTAPVGVAALFVQTLLDPKLVNISSFFESLGSYMFAVVLGLGIHGFVVLPLLLMIITKRSPLAFIRAMSPSLLTAFSTASSSATYPVTLECVTTRAGVSKRVSDFVLPLGATINMDGTALYEAVAAVFIANALGIDLSFTQQMVIVVTATLAAIGAAGVPSAGLVTMIIVLESVGLPASGYVLVVAVDRILDMCRTTINVWGDSVGAAVVARWVGDE